MMPKRFGVWWLSILSTACGAHQVPCDAADRAAQADLTVTAAACVSRINACKTVECVDQAERDCDAKGDARCQP